MVPYPYSEQARVKKAKVIFIHTSEFIKLINDKFEHN